MYIYNSSEFLRKTKPELINTGLTPSVDIPWIFYSGPSIKHLGSSTNN